MAFKLGSDTLLDSNQDGRLENLYIDGTLVLDGDDQGNVTLKNVIFDASLNVGQGTLDTDDVNEGTNNLYFTDARAQLALSNDIATLASDITTGDANTLASVQSLISASETSVLSTAQTYDASILSQAQAYTDSVVSMGTGNLTTDDISEASNLYYTDTRVNTYLTNNSFANETYVDNAESNAILVANAYTDARETAITIAYEAYSDQSELDANLYTDAREIAITTAYTSAIAAASSSGSTGSNAYTDQEVANAITTMTAYTDQAELDAISTANAYTDSEIANLVDSAPTVLDTLNELSAALGDDPNFATTISTQIGTKADASDLLTKVSKSGDTISGDLSFGNNNKINMGMLNNLQVYTTGSNSLIYNNVGDLYFYNNVDDRNIIFRTDNGSGGTANYIIANGATGGVELTHYGTEKLRTTADGITVSGNIEITSTPSAVNHAVTKSYVDTAVSGIQGFSGNYNDLTNKPTNVSAFTNDAGYLTSVGSISYNDLTDKPTIPTVPTNVSAFTNDAGYVTTDTNTTYSDGDGIGQTGTTFYVAAGNGLTQQANGLAMSGSFTGTFTASGDVCAYSDRALKRNIKTIEGALQKVTQMRGVTFLKDGKASTGVIAQEVETVLPEVVNQDQYGMRSVAYGNIVGTLIEAIKEQQVQIEELQSEIAKIKKK